MAFRIWTTWDYPIRVKGISLLGLEVYLTFRQGDHSITLSGDEIDMSEDEGDTVLRYELDQEQTGTFDEKKQIEVEVNWMVDGKRRGTSISGVEVKRNLLDKKIEA